MSLRKPINWELAFPILFLPSLILAAPLPNPSLTPGDTVEVSTEALCVPGYSASVRHVTRATKRAVFRRYAIPYDQRAGYEVDHLISLELGGSNSVANLWPEAYEPRPGAHEKDQVENELHRSVCDDEMTLTEAQVEISKDWLAVYQRLLPSRKR